MKRILIIFLSILSFCLSHAQIEFVNPKMEGDSCSWNCLPDYWTKCWFHFPTAVVTNGQPTGIPKNAYEGDTWAVLSAYSSGNFGTISQKLNCQVKKNHEYEFDFAGASYFVYSQFVVFANGKMQFFLNHDTCSEDQLAYTSPYLDTTWGVYTARFTANDDYEWIMFRPLFEGTGMELDLDALSSIYCVNAHNVTVTSTKDTIVPKSNSCVQLSAQGDITTYDSLYWIKLPNDTFAYNLWGVTVCPDSDAVYLVAIHDSVADCAGTWWSFDTVQVRVDLGLSADGYSDMSTNLTISPNPSNTSVTVKIPQIFIGGEAFVYNSSGILLVRYFVSNSFQEYDVSRLAKGMYFLQVRNAGQSIGKRLIVD